MKKAVLTLLAVIALMLAAIISNAQTIVKVGQMITSADTVQVSLQLNKVQTTATSQMIYITVDAANSGTIQFAVGSILINTSQYAWPAGSKVPITIRNGINNLRYKASASGQKFVITQ